MNKVSKINAKLFDEIKQVDGSGIESWSARDLMPRLGYDRWENFEKVIGKAKKASDNSSIDSIGQFRDITKALIRGNGARSTAKDYKLTRYACYLIAQNGDTTKPQNGTFTDAGYVGLYGLRAREIKDKKGIGDDDILNRAGVTELAANLFRITQTQEKLKSELDKGNKLGDKKASNTHFMVGGKVRQTIKDIGGTLPEDLIAEEDVKELKKRITARERQQLENKKAS